MKKNILFAFVLIIGSNSSLADGPGSNPMTANDGINYFPPAAKKDDQPKVAEFGVTYIKLGSSITTDSTNGNSSNLVWSLGHRRYADSFLYGLEYTDHHQSSGIQFNEYDLTAGYRPDIKSTFHVSPYIVGGAGLAFSEDTTHSGLTGGRGINYFADVGLDAISVELKEVQMKLMIGIKFTHDTLTGGPYNQMDFTDMYIGLGFGF
jgi:hypothetical protein